MKWWETEAVSSKTAELTKEDWRFVVASKKGKKEDLEGERKVEDIKAQMKRSLTGMKRSSV